MHRIFHILTTELENIWFVIAYNICIIAYTLALHVCIQLFRINRNFRMYKDFTVDLVGSLHCTNINTADSWMCSVEYFRFLLWKSIWHCQSTVDDLRINVPNQSYIMGENLVWTEKFMFITEDISVDVMMHRTMGGSAFFISI